MEVNPGLKSTGPLMGDLDARSAELIRELDRPFDEENQDHMDAVHQLWHAACPGAPFGGLSHAIWARLGLHGGDLAAELRKTGLASLHHLLTFATSQPGRFSTALQSECPLVPGAYTPLLLSSPPQRACRSRSSCGRTSRCTRPATCPSRLRGACRPPPRRDSGSCRGRSRRTVCRLTVVYPLSS